MDKFIKVNDIDICYRKLGTGHPLILIHGGTATMSSWDCCLEELSKEFCVITPDSRGHGKTLNPNGKLSYQLMADDVAGFIKKLGINNPFVLGHSDGGQVAIELGIRYPWLCKALVIGAAWYKRPDKYIEGLKSFGFSAKGKVDFGYLNNSFPELVSSWRRDHKTLEDEENYKRMLKQVSHLWWTDMKYSEKTLKKIVVPSLILLGDRDQYIPVNQAVDLYRMIDSAELAILPETDHTSMFQSPKIFIEIVKDFFLRHI